MGVMKRMEEMGINGVGKWRGMAMERVEEERGRRDEMVGIERAWDEGIVGFLGREESGERIEGFVGMVD